MVQSVGQQTEATLGRHLESVVARDVDRVMADYTDSSVIFTPDGPARGLDAIRGFFTNMLPVLTDEVLGNFKMVRQDVDGEVAYIVWSAPPLADLATDTFVVRDGKIVVPTFVAHMLG